MLKRSMVLAAVTVLTACGPSQPPQNASATDPNAAPPPVAAAPAPVPQAAAPTPPPPQPQAEREEVKPVHHHHVQAAAPVQEQPVVQQQQQVAPPPVCQDCGVIASVQSARQTGEAGMVGTLGGAAAGGLAGNQFGKGKGKIGMTVLGVLGGALAGREVESQVKAKTVYNVTVNMDDGSQRVITVDSLNGLGNGSKVRVTGNSLQYNGG